MHYRPTFAKVNLKNIQDNYIEMKKYAGKKVAAVIKANAYGHGIEEVARALEEIHADMFMVATFDEAMNLRENGMTTPILVIGWTSPGWAKTAAWHDISLTVFQPEWFDEVSLDLELSVHLKFDTGMNRIGIKYEDEWIQIKEKINENPLIRVTGAFTHFATADETNREYVDKQTKVWKEWKNRVEQIYKDVLFHISNSAHGITYPGEMEEMVRLGISLYGCTPSNDVPMNIDIKPALSLVSVVSHIKKIKKGDSIGYGATYQAKEEEWVATIPIGYADGILRRYSEHGEVLIGGKRRKIIGRICMDQLMVRVTREAAVGDEVVFIGSQEKESITAEEMAERSHTIDYEVLCAITNRVPRIYQS